jgi:flagellar export protein FliJ
MARHTYPLEPVLRFRTLLSEQAMVRLSDLERQRAALLRNRQQIEERQAAEQEALAIVQTQPAVDATEARRHQNVLEALLHQTQQIQAQVKALTAGINAQRAELAQRRVEQEALQVLKNRYLERVRAHEERAEMLALEEAAVIRAARARYTDGS